MFIHTLAAAAATAAPQNKFGIAEVLFPGGKPAWIPLSTFGILVFMSVGSFYILFTKWAEQSKVMKQHQSLSAFWRAANMREGAAKLEKNSAWRQIAERGVKALKAQDEDLFGQYLAEDLFDPNTGEIYAEAGDELNAKMLTALVEQGFHDLPILDIDHINVGPYIRNTLAVDKNSSREEALFDIYRVMRPGEPPTPETAETLFNGLSRKLMGASVVPAPHQRMAQQRNQRHGRRAFGHDLGEQQEQPPGAGLRQRLTGRKTLFDDR